MLLYTVADLKLRASEKLIGETVSGQIHVSRGLLVQSNI